MSTELSFVDNSPWSIERVDSFKLVPNQPRGIFQLPEFVLCLECQLFCNWDRYYAECPKTHFDQGFDCGCAHGSCISNVHCKKTVEE